MSSAVSPDMKVTREEINPCTIKLTVVCSPEQVDAGFNKAVKALGKKVRVPGFRPGMAPKAMVEASLNPQALFETAAEEIVKTAYEEAVTGEKLEPNGYPAVDITKFERDEKSFEFTAKVPLKPIVELADYKGLTAEVPEITVTDEEIDQQVEELRRRGGQKKEVLDRGVQEGDVCVVNIKVDDEDNDGRTFMVVAGQTFPDLDKVLKGLKPEEPKTAKLSFPDSFQNKEWAGEKKSAKVMVKSISAVQMPDLDDAFAKGFQAENVEDLRDKIKEGIERAKKRSLDEILRDNLLDQIIEKSTVVVAENTWEQVVDRRLRELSEQARMNNTTLEAAIKANGLTEEEYLEGLKKEAEVNVRRAVVIDKIFQENNLEVTNEDVGVHLTDIAMENQIPQEKFEEFVRVNGAALREEVVFRTMAVKVADLLTKHAQITTPGAAKPAKSGSSAKPKKTTRTKKTDKE